LIGSLRLTPIESNGTLGIMALDHPGKFDPGHWTQSRSGSSGLRKNKTDALEPAAAPSAPDQPRSEDDLIALAQLRSVGIPIDHIAAYSGRTVAEVEEKVAFRTPPEGASPVIQGAHHRAAWFYQRASECCAKAENAFNEAAKQEYLDMEHRWLMLARSYELSEHTADHTNEVAHGLRVVRPPEQQHPAIPRIRCPECGQRMRLAYIEPCADEQRSADTSMFTCTCGHTHQLTTDRTRVASPRSPTSNNGAPAASRE
jgi:hypothetical protein